MGFDEMDAVLTQRLHNQLLEESRFRAPDAVVSWMGAMQAQDYAGVKWALGLRLPGIQETEIEQAFTDGTFLRTHVMRPTWHFVTPTDIRWMLDLTAPRVIAGSAGPFRELELDDAVFQRSRQALTQFMQGGKQLTRPELGTLFAQAGIAAQDRRLSYLVMRAELDGVLCSGPRRGKQFTYMLLDERAPQASRLTRDEALAELTRRYFTSHGPATVHDFAWWSGLTIVDIKYGLDLVKDYLVGEEIDGKTYWGPVEAPTGQAVSQRVLLLPPFDEYTVAYRDHSPTRDPRGAEPPARPVFSGVIAIDGQVAGNWRRTFNRGAALIETNPYRQFSPAEQQALQAAAKRYEDYLGMRVLVDG